MSDIILYLTILKNNNYDMYSLLKYKHILEKNIISELSLDQNEKDEAEILIKELENYKFGDLLNIEIKKKFVKLFQDLREMSIQYDEYFPDPVVEYVDYKVWRKYETILSILENRPISKPPKEFWDDGDF